MKSWKTPTPEQVQQAMARLTHVEHHRYFFDKLENPNWLKPLEDRGFFQTPPPVLLDESAGTSSFPTWPASRYLARMAADDPQAVLGIILRMPDTENVRVHDDLVDAAIEMPPELAAQLVGKAKAWVRSRFHLLLPEKLGRLTVHLAKGGELDAALDLARTLLSVMEDRPSGDRGPGLGQPRAYFRDWDYGEILRLRLKDLVEAGRYKTLGVLCDILHAAIAIMAGRGSDRRPADGSPIWRPAIEDHEQNQPGKLESILVSAVRDAAEQIARHDSSEVAKLVQVLENERWQTFHRIALHLLRLFPDAAPELVSERLTDRARFDEIWLRHEYALLLRERFASLTPEQQATILGWIEEGPDLDELKARHQEQTGGPPTDESVLRDAEAWRLRRLALFGDQLPEDWKTRYEKLAAELGKPEHPEFVSYMTSSWGSKSPVTSADLGSMNIEDMMSFLKEWEPPPGLMGPSREGLSQQLQALVASQPDRYANEAERFKALEPKYVQAFFSGLRDAAKAEREFAWPPILGLACWVIGQSDSATERVADEEEYDPGWRWTRSSIADLFEIAFQPGDMEMTIGLRADAWGVLRALTDDPEPTPEYEAEYGGINTDPLTLSINTIRGKAMHAVVRYGLWVSRHLEELPDGEERAARGFDDMSEVREVLNLHLDPDKDPALAVRAVYGQWLPWLLLLDENWVTSHLRRIFPRDGPSRRLLDAAWETYVEVSKLYDNVFGVLRKEYSDAIGRIGTASEEQRHLRDPDEALAQHLMVVYWRGNLSLDDPLLVRFYGTAPPELCGRAMGFIGRSLKGDDPVPSEVLQRLQTLWARRLEAARSAAEPASRRAELMNFGWWFISSKFNDLWAMEQLQEALRIAKWAEPDHLVMERLSDLASAMPEAAVESLALMIEGARERWYILGWRDHARAILKTALDETEGATREAAVGVVDKLGALGYLEFRDLLSV